MNRLDMITACRLETQDTKKPYLWKDEEFGAGLNEAADEACIRGRLIENENIELSASVGDPYVDIPEYAWSIQRITFNGRKMLLLDKQMLNECEGDAWEDRTGTPVSCYEVGGKLRFYPIPDADGVVKVHAFCTPEHPMELDDDEPEGIKARLHVKLVDWALHCAYSKKDADTFDANLAEVHEVKFEQVFGPRPDEKAMRRLRLNVRRYVKGYQF